MPTINSPSAEREGATGLQEPVRQPIGADRHGSRAEKAESGLETSRDSAPTSVPSNIPKTTKSVAVIQPTQVSMDVNSK